MEEKCHELTNSESLHPVEHSTATSSKGTTLIDSDNSMHDQPSTSQSHSQNKSNSCAISMSLLQEDFANSRHEFAEVLDDETSTSGVLETFEISSSNSLPTCSDARADVGVDDSSSTDTIKLIGVSNNNNNKNRSNNFYNTSQVFVIKDDDDDDEELSRGGNEDDLELERETSKQLPEMTTSEDTAHLSNHISSVIVANGGATIYLETPVVDEQQHSQLIGIVGGDGSVSEFVEKAGKPKRLSDEFMLTDDADSSLNNKTVYGHTTSENVESNAGDRMSQRLKKMNINNTNGMNAQGCENNELPSSSSSSSSSASATAPVEQSLIAPSVADIESMDRIERRDFETEQRLTGAGGIVFKSNSLMNKDKLNLNMIRKCFLLNGTDSAAESLGNSSCNKANISTSGATGRVVSSDSKCAYKDPPSTPTSSRSHNNRLTKSTAKINLCSTLSQPQEDNLQQQKKQESEVQQSPHANIAKIQLKLQKHAATSASMSGSSSSSSSSNCSSSSSVIVEAPSTSMSANSSCNAGGGGIDGIFSNSNSNDSLMGGPSVSGSSDGRIRNRNNCSNLATSANINSQQLQEQPDREQEQYVEYKPMQSGCSRTSSIHAAVAEAENNCAAYDDAQPSTSSARCQYAPPPKSSRHVHASAQTNERYLSRGGSSGSAGGAIMADSTRSHFYNDDRLWADCEENNSDMEEVCTCQTSSSSSSSSDSSHGGSNTSLNETDDADISGVAGVKDGDLSNYIQKVSISEETATSTKDIVSSPSSVAANMPHRKRKYNDERGFENELNAAASSSGSGMDDMNGRKRMALDFMSTPRTSQVTAPLASTPTSLIAPMCNSSSPVGRRTPRSLIPTRDNPPPELQSWLTQFQQWSHAERLLAINRLIENCEPTQVRHMMKVIEPQFQRDFISLLPRELALQVLAYLEPKDLLRAAQTCRSWRFLCDDNLLWKEKCRRAQILGDKPKRGRTGNMPPIASPWKAAYMRQHIIEMNWRSRPIREPKVLKGHDDHVITCLQFSGNRIVSGSDDNTLKVWSAASGKCIRTLIGHTGGVWSSQMSGNIIISGSTDRTLKVWDMETGQCLHTLLGHTSTVRCMHLHGNKVVSGSRDATLRVWDIEQGTCLHVLVGHLAAVRCVQYDGKLIVSGAYDYMVKIWHPERQECLHTLSGHTNRVYSLQFDGVHVVSGSLDTSIRVWDVETGNCKHTLMGHQSLTSGMELRQNILVSGNADSTVKVWDITTGQCLQTLSGPNKHQSAVTCLQFNSRFVVTSSDDGTVKLWDVKTGEFIRNLVALDSGGSGGVVWRIRANDTKLICAVGSRNGTEETKLMVLDFDVEGACRKCS